MKKLWLLLGLLMAFIILQSQPQTFVYSLNGEKILFEKNEQIQYVHFVPNADAKSIETSLDEIKKITSSIDTITPNIYRCHLSGKGLTNFINNIKNNEVVSSYSSEYRLPGSKTMRWVTNEMYVRVKDEKNVI